MTSPSTTCYCRDTGTGTATDSDLELPWGPDDEVLVIFGSRSLEDLPATPRQQARAAILTLGQRDFPTPDYILSGGAEGADAVAEAVALELGVPMAVFAVNSCSQATRFRADLADKPFYTEVFANWGNEDGPREGPGAYLWRNCLMAHHATAGLALWDTDSNGTRRMITSCRAHDVDPLYVATVPDI